MFVTVSVPLKATLVFDDLPAVAEAQSVQIPKDDTSTVLSIKDALVVKYGVPDALIDVARCESTFRQFNDDGTVLRGVKDKRDVGVMQINEYYNGDEAKRLGFDIYTLDGNVGYAKYLYGKRGLKPWKASWNCMM